MILCHLCLILTSSLYSIQVVDLGESAVTMALHLPYTMASGLFLASLIASVSAATPSNGVEFLFPTQGATLHYNDYVEVQYISEFEAPWLYTFCRAASGSVSRKSIFSKSIFDRFQAGIGAWETIGADSP